MTIVIDLSAIDEGQPHWLTWEQRDGGRTLARIRAKHRAKYLAKRLSDAGFDPDEPRDPHGEWTMAGGGPGERGGLGPRVERAGGGGGGAGGFNALRQRLLPAVQAGGRVHVGQRGEWHEAIAANHGVKSGYVSGYYDPLNKRFISKEDLPVDSTEMFPNSMREFHYGDFNPDEPRDERGQWTAGIGVAAEAAGEAVEKVSAALDVWNRKTSDEKHATIKHELKELGHQAVDALSEEGRMYANAAKGVKSMLQGTSWGKLDKTTKKAMTTTLAYVGWYAGMATAAASAGMGVARIIGLFSLKYIGWEASVIGFKTARNLAHGHAHDADHNYDRALKIADCLIDVPDDVWRIVLLTGFRKFHADKKREPKFQHPPPGSHYTQAEWDAMSPLMRQEITEPRSWVVVHKETKTPIMETFSEDIKNKINNDLYEAVPAMEYLASFNERAEAAGRNQLPPPPVPPGPTPLALAPDPAMRMVRWRAGPQEPYQLVPLMKYMEGLKRPAGTGVSADVWDNLLPQTKMEIWLGKGLEKAIGALTKERAQPLATPPEPTPWPTPEALEEPEPEDLEAPVVPGKRRRKVNLEYVKILTAGDDRVCDICNDAAADGPYTLDEARGMLPFHVGCRCSVIPAFDKRFKGNDALVGLKLQFTCEILGDVP